MGFFDKLFGGKSKDENTAKFTNQSKTVLTPVSYTHLDVYKRQHRFCVFAVEENRQPR